MLYKDLSDLLPNMLNFFICSFNSLYEFLVYLTFVLISDVYAIFYI